MLESIIEFSIMFRAVEFYRWKHLIRLFDLHGKKVKSARNTLFTFIHTVDVFKLHVCFICDGFAIRIKSL